MGGPDLDEDVYELAMEQVLDRLNAADDTCEQETIIAEAVALASRINNEGPEAQEAFLNGKYDAR